MKTNALFALTFATASLTFAPMASAQTADAGASPANPYASYDALLRAVVRPTGVQYATVRARIAELRAFHAWLATHGPSTTPSEFTSASARKAYWLNAYNATVLLGVAEAPATMNNVLTYLPDSGFFRARRWRIDGRERTLDQIENTEVRPVFRDARVHMALNCGARSCPPLRANAFTPGAVDRQLDEQATRYLNAPGNITIDEAAHTVRVVQLFEWFRDDFATRVPGRAAYTFAGALGFIHSYASPALRARLEAACGADGGACTVTYAPYDWTLNAAR